MSFDITPWVSANTLDFNKLYFDVETDYGRDLNLLRNIKATFPHWISLTASLERNMQRMYVKDHHEWCLHTCSYLWFDPLAAWWGFDFWIRGESLFMFESDADAVQFKLVWGGITVDPNIATVPV